jgi:HlyD family secretion protein
MKRSTWIGSVVALAAVAGGAYLVLRDRHEEIRWRTAKVDRGSITQRVTASGTLNALIQVPVGTQVSGVVVDLKADFSSLVHKGQVIGQIDPTPWQTALKAAEAGLQSATATKANAEIVYKRNLELWKAKLLSDNDLDGFKLALQTSTANLETAKANLQTAKTNLGYCTITAPVDGVVVARLVDVGQTVAASFSTPSLFTIAQDLSKMKVSASIDEADIGQVKVGQRAFFTVESYPDKQFKGVVSEVQLNPVVTNNVVTYNVIMEVDNEPRTAYVPSEAAGPSRAADPPPARRMGALAIDRAGSLEYSTARYMPPGSPVYSGNLALFPGMTADCSIVTNRKEEVLRVPSAALRFNPSAFVPMSELIPAGGPSGASRSGAAGGPSGAPAAGAPRPSGGTPGPAQGAAGGSVLARGVVARQDERVWVLDGGRLRAIPVKAGISDGMFTEVSGEGITPGLAVVTGIEDFKKALAAGGGPLMGGGMRH